VKQVQRHLGADVSTWMDRIVDPACSHSLFQFLSAALSSAKDLNVVDDVGRTGSFSGFCLSLGSRIPCGLFTPWSFYPVVFAIFLVLKDLGKWRIFHRLLT
jgi:hypothetical protein